MIRTKRHFNYIDENPLISIINHTLLKIIRAVIGVILPVSLTSNSTSDSKLLFGRTSKSTFIHKNTVTALIIQGLKAIIDNSIELALGYSKSTVRVPITAVIGTAFGRNAL